MPDARKLFETLVREHADMLSIYLRSALGNTTDVDDLFQETMIVAWRRLDDFDQSQPFGPWLRGMARKLLLAHDRKRCRWLCDSEMLNHIESRLSSLSHPSVSSYRELDALILQVNFVD
jgi:RNA polymerase sigma-70 factor (ECF subfamily)